MCGGESGGTGSVSKDKAVYLRSQVNFWKGCFKQLAVFVASNSEKILGNPFEQEEQSVLQVMKEIVTHYMGQIEQVTCMSIQQQQNLPAISDYFFLPQPLDKQ